MSTKLVRVITEEVKEVEEKKGDAGAIGGLIVGVIIGALLGGPVGAAIGGVVGVGLCSESGSKDKTGKK